MLSFTEAQIRTTTVYSNAIMNGYKITPRFYGDKYMTFTLRKGNKKTCASGRIETHYQFYEQLIMFMQELS